MLREIIKVKSSDYTIHIPEEYIDREVEISIVPVEYGDLRSHENNHNALKKTANNVKSKHLIILLLQQHRSII